MASANASPLDKGKINVLSSVNSALARARADLNEVRAMRDRNVRKIHLQ
jgi:hypothetical protein